MEKRKLAIDKCGPDAHEEFMNQLNDKFLKKCEDYTKMNKSLLELFQYYRKYVEEIMCTDEINFDISSEFSESTEVNSHCVQSDETVKQEKLLNVQFKDEKFIDELYRTGTYQKLTEDICRHKCLKTEIYKFLVKYYDVKCPYYKDTTKRIKKRISKTKKKDHKDFEVNEIVWPFMAPSTNPRSVFDKGPTREEIGEYNRRIFTAYTENLDYKGNELSFNYNPDWFDEDSCEKLQHEITDNIIKAECNLFIYDGEEYIFRDKSIVRVFDTKEENTILTIKNKCFNYSFEMDVLLSYYVDGDLKLDALNQNNLQILRFVFNNVENCKRFAETFSVN